MQTGPLEVQGACYRVCAGRPSASALGAHSEGRPAQKQTQERAADPHWTDGRTRAMVFPPFSLQPKKKYLFLYLGCREKGSPANRRFPMPLDHAPAAPQHGAQPACGRIGDNGERCFHARFERKGKEQGGAAKAIAGMDYDARVGPWDRRSDELEAESGRSRTEMAALLTAAEQATTRKNGKFLLDGIIELPLHGNQAFRRDIAEQIAAWFEARECPFHWAIHSHNSAGRYQPHMHFTTTMRPVRRGSDGAWFAESAGAKGRPGCKPVLDSIGECKQWREELAGIVNRAATNHRVELDAKWSGKGFREIGKDRLPKKRLPIAEYYRQTRGALSPVRNYNELAENAPDEARALRKSWAQERAEEAAAEKSRKAETARQKQQQTLERLDAISREDFEAEQHRLASDHARKLSEARPAVPPGEKLLAWGRDLQGRGFDIPEETFQDAGELGRTCRLLQQAERARKAEVEQLEKQLSGSRKTCDWFEDQLEIWQENARVLADEFYNQRDILDLFARGIILNVCPDPERPDDWRFEHQGGQREAGILAAAPPDTRRAFGASLQRIQEEFRILRRERDHYREIVTPGSAAQEQTEQELVRKLAPRRDDVASFTPGSKPDAALSAAARTFSMLLKARQDGKLHPTGPVARYLATMPESMLSLLQTQAAQIEAAAPPQRPVQNSRRRGADRTQ